MIQFTSQIKTQWFALFQLEYPIHKIILKDSKYHELIRIGNCFSIDVGLNFTMECAI